MTCASTEARAYGQKLLLQVWSELANQTPDQTQPLLLDNGFRFTGSDVVVLEVVAATGQELKYVRFARSRAADVSPWANIPDSTAFKQEPLSPIAGNYKIHRPWNASLIITMDRILRPFALKQFRLAR